MDTLEAIYFRHSVRSYTDKEIEGETLEQLKNTIDKCNSESGLNIQLCLNEPQAFSSLMAKYGKFKNAKNYIALVGKNDGQLDEKIGYYGEIIVIKAQQLGLNTCWVAMTYNKGKCAAKVKPGEKLLLVISVGFGESNGVPHKTKPIEKLCTVSGNIPDWFKKGIEAVQLAPTAMNQQKFSFELNGNTVKTASGSGFYTKVDLGIAKYHFEIGAGKNGWEWSK
ncbi:nitroreductase [Treponema sp. R8-4-B8]